MREAYLGDIQEQKQISRQLHSVETAPHEMMQELRELSKQCVAAIKKFGDEMRFLKLGDDL